MYSFSTKQGMFEPKIWKEYWEISRTYNRNIMSVESAQKREIVPVVVGVPGNVRRKSQNWCNTISAIEGLSHTWIKLFTNFISNALKK